MPKTITTTLYTFDELAPPAKQKAIEDHRHINTEHDDASPTHILNEFERTLNQLGYETLDFQYTGFYSQGDGASFTATLNLPLWLEAHKLKTKYKKAYHYAKEYGTGMITLIRISSHYSHENTVATELSGCDPNLFDEHKYSDNDTNDAIMKELEAITKLIEQERLEYCDTIYTALKQNYEFQQEDEQVADTLEANDYLFHADGTRASNQLTNE